MTMKKYMLYAGILLAMLAGACNEEDEQRIETFSIEGANISASKEGATVGFYINSTQKWAISKPADADWITFLTNPTGKKSVEVLVQVAVNLSSNFRTTTLVVTAADGKTESVTVNQRGNDLPEPAGVIYGLNANDCSISTTDYSVTLSIAPIRYATEYVWYKNGVAIAGATGMSYTVSDLGTATYTAAGKNVSGTGPVSPPKVVTTSVCPPVIANGVSLSPNTATLQPGNTLTLTANVTPSNTTNKTVSWASNNTAVVTISNGTVTAVGGGNATITVTTQDGSNKTAICVIKVQDWLDVVSFATSQEWVVPGTGGRPTQTWSDVVTATGSNKTAINKDIADGCTFPGHKSHLYTFHAVRDYGSRLCPSPWRVPTRQDYIDLDLNFGGDGTERTGSAALTFLTDKYINQWGIDFAGYVWAGQSTPWEVGDDARLWTQTPTYFVYYQQHNGGKVSPTGSNNNAGTAAAVRCVKN